MRQLLTLLIIFFAAATVFAEPATHHGMSVDNAESTDACMSCHNGMHAIDAAYSTSASVCLSSSPHPVLITYAPAGKEKAFRFKEQLKSLGIRLENGKVTCLSCHDLRHDNAGHLAVGNEGSRLCLTCHLK